MTAQALNSNCQSAPDCQIARSPSAEHLGIASRAPVAVLRRSLLLLLLLVMLDAVVARSAAHSFAHSEEPNRLDASQVIVGINGHYRLGRTTAVRLAETASAALVPDSAARSQLQMETLDGDGVRVRYDVFPIADEGTATSADTSALAELGYVVTGSEAAPLVLRKRTESSEQILLQTRFPVAGVPAAGPSLIPSTMPWVIVIGDPLGVDSIGASNVLVDKAARIAVTQIEAANSLPEQSFGYDGVDLVMINAAGAPVLNELRQTQRDALVGWIRRGGRLFVCLGESAETLLSAAPWLAKLLPLEEPTAEATLQRYDPAAFETYTSSQTPLAGFSGVKLPRLVGLPLINGRTTRRVAAVLAARYAVGLGGITVVAADLDRPEFASWPERLVFLKQVVGAPLAEPSAERENRNRVTSFGDLAGQMRGVLDQFPIKPRFSFSFVSLIVMLLIAAIGPLDYLLVNRLWGKPLLGWVSFPLIAITLSLFLVLQAAPATTLDESLAPDNLLRANQFQVTDIDMVDGAGRAFAWCSLYSHEPARVDITYSARETVDEIRNSQASPSRSFLFPMGYPGREFGGIQLAGENQVFSPYEVKPLLRPAAHPAGVDAVIKGLTIAPRSSRSVATRMIFETDNSNMVRLTRRPGSDLLRGAFVNPLPVDVLDSVLVYGNWVYLLPTRVPAGGTVPELSELRQKNFRWRLTRQESSGNTPETSLWSPNDFTDVGRVAELMLFHRAAGAELYTSLRHDVVGDLDLSEVLVEDRCILVGRTEHPLFDFQVTVDQGDSADDATIDSVNGIRPPGSQLSVIRVILPVRSTRLN